MVEEGKYPSNKMPTIIVMGNSRNVNHVRHVGVM